MKTLLLASILTISWSACSQSLSNEVIGSAGDHFSSASASISWTAGETMIDTYVAGSNQLTQGFHQPTRQMSGIDDEGNEIVISLSPNPATDYINFNVSGTDQSLSLVIMDTRGRIVYEDFLYSQPNGQITLENLERGLYFLKIQDNNQTEIGTVKFQKM